LGTRLRGMGMGWAMLMIRGGIRRGGMITR
jgi:hypothetical protein